MEARQQFKGVNSIKFYRAFSSDEDCYKYLSEIKWNGTEFVCPRCGHTRMSSEELAEEYEVRQKTCWEFKRKVQQAMKSSGRYPLDGEVHVDEFYVGGEEEGTHGRGANKKRLVIVALEIVPDGVGRAYAEVIDNASAKTLRGFFHRRISLTTHVITDEWNGYKPLIDEYKLMEHRPYILIFSCR